MKIEENVRLAPYSTFHVGGPARYFVVAKSKEEVEEAFHFADTKGIPVFVLGGGSNILVSDAGFPGLVLQVGMNKISLTEGGGIKVIHADAGTWWDTLVEESVRVGCVGAENLSLIPGTVGGAIVQNIGAYGCEVKELVESVDVYDVREKKVRTLSRTECKFGYRESIFKIEEGAFVVLGATFRFVTKGAPNIAYKDIAEYLSHEGIVSPTPHDVRRAVVCVRTTKFPIEKESGTAGSFFKNPIVPTILGEKVLAKYPDAVHTRIDSAHIKLSAAWIIDHVLHMRGVRVGQVGCAQTQALVIVNYGGASCDEIKKFAEELQEKRFPMIEVDLEREVIFVGA